MGQGNIKQGEGDKTEVDLFEIFFFFCGFVGHVAVVYKLSR